jgi:hypothetical protein
MKLGTKEFWTKVLKQGLQVLFHIVMTKFPIPENCSAYVPMILKEFCSLLPGNFYPLNFVGVICKHSSVISLTETCIYIYICTRVYHNVTISAASVVNFEKFLSSKRHNSHKIQEIKISWQYAQLHMVSLQLTKFHEILFSSFRGVNSSETTEQNFMKLGRL